jgi:thymidylate synthase (FAD)
MEMKIELISITQPVNQLCRTPEELIAYCARVSSPENQNNHESSAKLLRYCIRNKHWSIFEQVNLGFSVKTTRDIARQILRHGFKFQEFSQRYSVATNFVTNREARLQDYKNRQNSIDIIDQDLQDDWEQKQKKALSETLLAYDWALSKGIAKEVARAVLPEGMTESSMYVNGNLRQWIHYCEVRRGNGTQKEHRLIAEEIWKIIGEHFPNVVEAVDKEDQETLLPLQSKYVAYAHPNYSKQQPVCPKCNVNLTTPLGYVCGHVECPLPTGGATCVSC